MKKNSTKLLQDLAAFLLSGPKTPKTAKAAAEMVRADRQYRWIGVYKVERGEFVIVAGTGDEPPAYRRFPMTQGLCGAVADSLKTLIVADVRKDPRWLPAFWTTLSEIVVPIISESTGRLLGVLDVESEKLDAFGEDDRDFLEHVAGLLAGKLCTAKQRNAPAH